MLHTFPSQGLQRWSCRDSWPEVGDTAIKDSSVFNSIALQLTFSVHDGQETV